MATDTTTFTKDVQGRYLCNSYFEAEAWRREGGRPFDIIVIGGGTFGAAIAEHLWFRQAQAGGACARWSSRRAFSLYQSMCRTPASSVLRTLQVPSTST